MKPTFKQRMILLVLADAPAIHDGTLFRLNAGKGASLSKQMADALIKKGWAIHIVDPRVSRLEITALGIEAVQDYL